MILEKDINVTIQSNENERNFIEHINRSNIIAQNQLSGVGQKLDENHITFWENKIRDNYQGYGQNR